MQQVETYNFNYKQINDGLKNNRISIFKISASWCKPCKNKDFLIQYNKLKTNYKDNVKFYEFDVDENSDIINYLTKNYNTTVESLPTLLLFHNNNKNMNIEIYEGIECLNDLQSNINKKFVK